MPVSSAKRGRPPKFGRAAQLVTLTLPEDVITWMATIDRDLAWAIVKLHQRALNSSKARQPKLAELVQIPGQRALILVRPEAFSNLKSVSIIPLADGRGFLALDAGRGVADLELAVIDRLEVTSLSAAERADLNGLRILLKQWRLEGIEFESRSVVVARRPEGGRGRPLAAVKPHSKRP
jgi:hypothetical protein